MESTIWKSVIFLLLQVMWISGNSTGRSELEKEILQKLFMTNKFNIYVRPQNVNQLSDEPVEVSVSLFILNIDIDEKNQECSLRLYFREEWQDSRLAYDNQGKLNFLSIHDAVGLWTPDLFIVNEKFGQLHSVTKPNVFVRIYPSGKVLYSQRLTVKMACPMDLRKYPFDTQICALPIESYGYTAYDINLKWKPDTTFGTNFIPGFHIFYSPKEDVILMAAGNYSRLELNVHFNRLVYPQLIHVYIPLLLLVVASWIPFWLRPSNPVLRLTIILTITFTILILLQSVGELLHRLFYFTALDVWVGFCGLIVFAAFFENVYVIASHTDKPMTFQTNKKEIPELPGGGKDRRMLMDILAGKEAEGQSNVDVLARMMFPSIFAVFSIIYLAYYLI